MSDLHDRLGHAVGDARKRLLELPPNHDEQHAHLHEWPEPNIERGED